MNKVGNYITVLFDQLFGHSTFSTKIHPKIEIPERNFALSHCLMVAEELPISLWQSQVISHGAQSKVHLLDLIGSRK
jgi:hypothetical protein